MIITIEKKIDRYDFIAELRKARKACICRECRGVIRQGEDYYSIRVAGGGLRSIKFPNKVHVACVDVFLERYREPWERQDAFCRKLRLEREASA